MRCFCLSRSATTDQDASSISSATTFGDTPFPFRVQNVYSPIGVAAPFEYALCSSHCIVLCIERRPRSWVSPFTLFSPLRGLSGIKTESMQGVSGSLPHSHSWTAQVTPPARVVVTSRSYRYSSRLIPTCRPHYWNRDDSWPFGLGLY